MAATPHQRSPRIDLTSGPLLGHLLRMAIPVAASMMLRSLYSLVDAAWLGRVDKVALAAPGVSGPVLFIAVAAGFGLGAGGTAVVSQFTGSGEHRRADRAAGQTMLLLCALGTLMAFPVVLLARPILWLTRVPPEVLPSATVYLRVFMLGLPFMAFSMGYGAALRALGDTITVVLIAILSNILNMALDPLLIFGLWGFPQLGVAGAALASVISQIVGAVGCFLCMMHGRAGLHVTRADFLPDWALIWQLVKVAVPASLGHMVNSWGFLIFQVILNSLGVTVVSAFTIGHRVLHFFNAPMHAMASATAPVVGQALGAGNVPLARRAVRLSTRLLGSLMLVPTLFLLLGGHWVARFFIDDPEVIDECRDFFRIVPMSAYFFGVLMVLMSAFYGSGHTLPAMVVSVVRVFFVRIPSALVLAFVVGLGSTGAYTGMVAGNVSCAMLALYLFRKGEWESAVVAKPTSEDRPETAEGCRPNGPGST